jgi:signal transduction histidine kinase
VLQATRDACVVFGAGDTASLRVIWRHFHDTLQAACAQARQDSTMVEVWLTDPHSGVQVQGEIYPLDGTDAGLVIVVRSEERVAGMDRVLRLAVDQEVLRTVAPSISHAYRDSLNSLTVNAELLERTLQPVAGRDETAVQQRCLAALRRGIDQIARLNAHVIDEARPGAGSSTRVTASAIVRSVIALVSPTAAAQHVVIRYEDAGIGAEVRGRVGDLRQALLSVLINALEAMPEGGDVRLATYIEGRCVVVRVIDTGPGVPAEVEPFIWELFFSTKERGHGIGLAVARRIASAHGGTLTLDQSRPGAAFSLRLPLAV